MSNEQDKALNIPVLDCRIEGPVTLVRQRTVGNAIATTRLKTKDFVESFVEAYKPYYELKSPYLNVVGNHWQAVRYWQTDSSGKVIVICEATPRPYEFVANGINYIRETEGEIWKKYLGPGLQELIDNKRVQIDTTNRMIRAKLFMPGTVMVSLLIPKGSSASGAARSYGVGYSAICYTDEPTKDLNSEVYSLPLPNIYAAPFNGDSSYAAHICWGDALSNQEFQIENSHTLLDRFYSSKFNMDLVDWRFYAKTLPYYVKGPNYDPKEPGPKRMNMEYLLAGMEESAKYEHGKWLSVYKQSLRNIIRQVGGQD